MHQLKSGANWARILEIESHEKDLVLVIGSFPGQKIQIAAGQRASGSATPDNAKGSPTHFWARSDASKVHFEYINPGNVLLARLSPADHKSRVRVFVGKTPSADITNKLSWIAYPEKTDPKLQWPETITTQWEPHSTQDSFIQEQLPLPENNPWGRKVRSSAMAFHEDGTLFMTTFDGDVWTAVQSQKNASLVEWRRVAA